MYPMGWGVTGDAATITQNECNRNSLTGDLRRGENTVLRVTAHNSGGGLLEYMMKRPGDGGRQLEAICSSGDSGGPCFIEHDGKPYVAGTNSGWGSFSGQICAYGSIDQYCRISTMHDWIMSVVARRR